jgi:phage terminase small subunit
MGRPRTPTHVLEDRGAFINHPERRGERANEPVPNGELRKSPPASLTPDEKKIWREFIKKVPAGVLGDCDEYWLAMAVRLEWKERSGKISISERTQYMNLLGKLGMNPSERSKVSARPVAKKEDEWSDLDNTQTM